MAKLRCDCGHVIVDQTDDLPYKAEVIPDQNHNEIFEKCVSNRRSGLSTDDIDGLIGVWNGNTKTMYQCEACSRLLLQVGSENKYASFLPEGDDCKNILVRVN